jgi:hypothetical protein
MKCLVLAIAVLGSACATTIAVERPSAGDTLVEINSMLKGAKATVAHIDTPNRTQQGDIASEIAVTPEKAIWTVWESDFARDRGTPPGRRVESPIDALRNITLCDASCRAKGALEGLGVGVVAAVFLGGILYSACHGEYCYGSFILAPMLTVPIGTLLGLSVGHRNNIEFEQVTKR